MASHLSTAPLVTLQARPPQAVWGKILFRPTCCTCSGTDLNHARAMEYDGESCQVEMRYKTSNRPVNLNPITMQLFDQHTICWTCATARLDAFGGFFARNDESVPLEDSSVATGSHVHASLVSPTIPMSEGAMNGRIALARSLSHPRNEAVRPVLGGVGHPHCSSCDALCTRQEGVERSMLAL